MVGYSTVLLSSLLLSGVSLSSAQSNSIVLLGFALKGDVGSSIKDVSGELVDINWVSKSGKTFSIAKNQVLNHQKWTNYTIRTNAPVTDPVSHLSVKFLNDKVQTIKGEVKDWNVRLDIDNVILNGEKLSGRDVRNFLRGPVFDELASGGKPQGYQTLDLIRNGNFIQNGEYHLIVPVRPSTAACDDPTSQNIVCFDLKGQIGDILPQEERVDIGYILADGTKTVSYKNYPLFSTWQKIMVQAPNNTLITKVFVNFLNKKQFNVKGVMRDRTVMFRPDSLEINHVKVDFAGSHIGGPVYQESRDTFNFKQMGAIVGGMFNKNGEYHINIPKTRNAKTESKYCQVGSGGLSFSLKGKSWNPQTLSNFETVKITYKLGHGYKTLHDIYHLNSDWQSFKICHPKAKISQVLVSLLNKNELSDGSGVELRLNDLTLNGTTINSPCGETVAMKNGKLFINIAQ